MRAADELLAQAEHALDEADRALGVAADRLLATGAVLDVEQQHRRARMWEAVERAKAEIDVARGGEQPPADALVYEREREEEVGWRGLPEQVPVVIGDRLVYVAEPGGFALGSRALVPGQRRPAW
ncbi:hypothetical protein AB0N38_10685 [Micromonospora aurantiaca]|uniref:hypothetical protein n=1 Tax=Micromonospora aurantiaca (nom. illeg.) TaxID=47850 RepID=UPI0034160E44